MNRTLKIAIDEGLNFLAQNQKSSGEFVALRAKSESLDKSESVGLVFITSVILHSLIHLNHKKNVQEMRSQAITFLIKNREQNGFWRFFGNCDKRYAPDLDDTCCVLAALKECKVKMDYNFMIQRILQYKREDGSFWTWVLDEETPKCWKNDVDWAVNANVLFFFSLLDHAIPDTEQYLRSIVDQNIYKQPTIYYKSPFSFIYFLTRAIFDGRASGLMDIIPEIQHYLLSGLCIDNPIDKVLRVASLINIDEIQNNGDYIETLLGLQEYDGGWAKGAFFHESPNYWYGSRALTTAIAIESITKYLIKINKTV